MGKAFSRDLRTRMLEQAPLPLGLRGEPSLGVYLAGGFCDGDKHARSRARFVAHRAIGEVEPSLFGFRVSFEDKLLARE